jgi:spermidine/putrescine transport system ATP-binding protein
MNDQTGILEVQNITKTFEGQLLLRGVSFTLDEGETVCLLGPSGSGKSTLLRIIAGLETAESGAVLWKGQSLEGVPVHKRNFGLMFQDYALFPHRSVAENVAFGLRMQGLARDVILQRVGEALEQMNLSSFSKRRVTDLSGGEQQRVALARALAPRPRLLMLDEPLGALDRALKTQLLSDLRHLLRNSGIPAIYVTHDQEEAFALADRMVLLSEGIVAQAGSPDVVYNHPVSPWVAQFMGQTNLVSGRVMGKNPLRVETGLGCFQAERTGDNLLEVGQVVRLLFRPGGARLAQTARDRALLRGTAQDVVFRGDGYRLELRVADGQVFTFLIDRSVPVGEAVQLELAPEGILAFAEGRVS